MLLADTPEISQQSPALRCCAALQCFNGSHLIMVDSLSINSPAARIKFRIFVGATMMADDFCSSKHPYLDIFNSLLWVVMSFQKTRMEYLKLQIKKEQSSTSSLCFVLCYIYLHCL
ncbi:hypothetical protein I7I48_02131 [Histoplasma ohiense]|nr:hypothetical protein I7I48_02131 [Histoplasma ohiense (nom. inval.)]